MTKRIYLFPLFFLAASSLASAPNKTTVDLGQGSGEIDFHATGHPSMLKINGKGDKPKGELSLQGDQVKGSATFDLSSMDTGISMRNKHMKEKYLEVNKYPEAKITITQMKLPKTLSDGVTESGIPFNATLNLHGVDKPIQGLADVTRAGDRIKTRAQFALKIKDYGIASPSFAGVTMADDVQVVVQTDAPIKEAQSK